MPTKSDTDRTTWRTALSLSELAAASLSNQDLRKMFYGIGINAAQYAASSVRDLIRGNPAPVAPPVDPGTPGVLTTQFGANFRDKFGYLTGGTAPTASTYTATYGATY